LIAAPGRQHGLFLAGQDNQVRARHRHPPSLRQLRSELAFVSALPVADLRAQADDVARRIRELDTDIQRTNWEVDLLDE
jgi:hypothetical protein